MWSRLKRGAARVLRSSAPQTNAKKALTGDFEAYKLDHPNATFAQFYAAQAMQTIGKGKAHSTLGLHLYERAGADGGERDYLEAGRSAFARYRRLFKIRPGSNVVDYGCGSLRLGIHFLEFLKPGNYLGLDVTRDFIDIGASAVPELIAQKNPQLYAIDKTSLEVARNFGADFVISNAVSYHVHPDEVGAYLNNLAAICSKPGATLVFDAKCADEIVQFRSRSWAYPLKLYIDMLRPLAFVAQHKRSAIRDIGKSSMPLEHGILEFRRD